jgi:hypothetical protein
LYPVKDACQVPTARFLKWYSLFQGCFHCIASSHPLRDYFDINLVKQTVFTWQSHNRKHYNSILNSSFEVYLTAPSNTLFPSPQVGLVSDDKLVDLALSADTVNTVKTLRDITETCVEPLALMSQLATIITDMC